MGINQVTISNMALSHVGAEATVVSIDPPDGSVEAGYCAQFYDIARTELLEAFPWWFARRRKSLTQATNPSSIWTYAYAIPSDCVAPVRVLNSTILADDWLPFSGYITPSEQAIFDERGSADFEIEGNVLLTHEPNAVLLYRIDVIDPSKFSAAFVGAMSYLLGSYIAGPLIKGSEGARTARALREIALQAAAAAAARNANESAESSEFTPSSVRARA